MKKFRKLSAVISVILCMTILLSGNVFANNSSEEFNADEIQLSFDAVQISRTQYDYNVTNIGLRSYAAAQIKAPTSDGKFHNKELFGYWSYFTVTWSGASSGAYFKVYSYDESGQYDYVQCSGTSGSKRLTIPPNTNEVRIFISNSKDTDLVVTNLNLASGGYQPI